ncbi:MAG: 30S ribosomal protein S17 [Anaerolineae bacterium]|nr:30S ribosomal protein S17 [Anaerolineae bacterium]
MPSNSRRRLVGTVISNKMDKTVVITVGRKYRHPLYGKVVQETKRFMAHDENNDCEIGDEVVIVESRPISKNKRWAVQEILREDFSARTTEVSDLGDEIEEELVEAVEEIEEAEEEAEDLEDADDDEDVDVDEDED